MKENRLFNAYKPSERAVDDAPVAAWQRIYCSLALILAVFFVMLVSYSTADVNRVKSFHGQFDRQPKQQEKGYSTAVKLGETEEASIAEAEKTLQRILADAGLQETAVLDRSRGGLRVQVPNPVIFEAESAELRPDVQPCFREIARWMQREGYGITVEGHTDDLPPRGKFASNWELSTAHAVGVVRFFLEEEGIEAERLRAVGFAQYRPLFSNASAAGRAKNGRVELVIAPAGNGEMGRQ